MAVSLRLVTLKNPCSSCLIKLPYIRKLCEEIAETMADVDFHEVQISSREDLQKLGNPECGSPGISLMPLVYVGEDLCWAGVVPQKSDLEARVRMLQESHGEWETVDAAAVRKSE